MNKNNAQVQLPLYLAINFNFRLQKLRQGPCWFSQRRLWDMLEDWRRVMFCIRCWQTWRRRLIDSIVEQEAVYLFFPQFPHSNSSVPLPRQRTPNPNFKLQISNFEWSIQPANCHSGYQGRFQDLNSLYTLRFFIFWHHSRTCSRSQCLPLQRSVRIRSSRRRHPRISGDQEVLARRSVATPSWLLFSPVRSFDNRLARRHARAQHRWLYSGSSSRVVEQWWSPRWSYEYSW